jgi:hypothetical protein
MNKNSFRINFLLLMTFSVLILNCSAGEEKSLSIGAHIHIFLMKLIGKHDDVVKKISKLQSSSSSSSDEEDRIDYVEPQSHPLIRAENSRPLKCLRVANLIHCN